MNERLLDLGLFFFNPRSRVEYVLKLVALCSAITFFAMLVERVLGFGASHPTERYFLIVFMVATPVISFAMVLTKRTLRLQRNLEEIAYTDTLTGLMNRRAFMEEMSKLGDGALLLIDADHFKAINDKYGHPVGDAVLKAISEHLKRNFREEDLIARVGGEEFAVYLLGADSSMIDEIGDRVCTGLVVYNDTVRIPVKVTLSIGAAYAAMANDTEQLIERADLALYEAKHSGRACLNFWQPAITSRF